MNRRATALMVMVVFGVGVAGAGYAAHLWHVRDGTFGTSAMPWHVTVFALPIPTEGSAPIYTVERALLRNHTVIWQLVLEVDQNEGSFATYKADEEGATRIFESFAEDVGAMTGDSRILRFSYDGRPYELMTSQPQP